MAASVLRSNGDGYESAVKDGRIAGVRGRADDRELKWLRTRMKVAAPQALVVA